MNRAGYALLMVLWTMVFLIVVASTFVLSNRLNTAMTRNYKEKTLSYAIALRGYNEALKYLLSDRDPAVDFLDRKGLLHLDRESRPLPARIEFTDGVAEVRITPEDAKVNLNFLRDDLLRGLLLSLGYPPERVDEMVDSLKDWIDPDDAHRLNGAEDEYYRGLGYTSKNQPLDTPWELLLVKGFGRDVLYGSEEHPPLLSYITTYGTGGININTASERIMRLMGIPEPDIEMVMRYRDPEIGGLRVIPGVFASKGFNKTASTVFSIEVSGHYKNSDIGYNIHAVVQRRPHIRGFKAEVLYWREDVIYSSTKDKRKTA